MATVEETKALHRGSNVRADDGEIVPVSEDGVQLPRIQVAAIDNGLAFPTQHPNRIRSYPYGWLSNPVADEPFSRDTAMELLPLLTAQRTEEMMRGLEARFRLDPDFSPKSFAKQKSVYPSPHLTTLTP